MPSSTGLLYKKINREFLTTKNEEQTLLGHQGKEAGRLRC